MRHKFKNSNNLNCRNYICNITAIKGLFEKIKKIDKMPIPNKIGSWRTFDNIQINE